MICEKCGTHLEEDALFCGNCGTAVETNSAHKATDNSSYDFVYPEIPLPSKKTTVVKQRNLLVPIVIFIAVIMTLIAAFLAFKLISDSGEVETSSNSNIVHEIENDFDADSEMVHDYSSSVEEGEINFAESKDYIYPSDTEYLVKSQLENLTKEEVALLRNEIYARHGYVFNLEEYKNYFSSKSWYVPNENFDESMFNPIEKANKDLIVEYEIEMEWR